MTRTPSLFASMSRFTGASSASTSARKAASEGACSRSWASASAMNFVDRVGRFRAEPLDQRAPPAVGAEQRARRRRTACVRARARATLEPRARGLTKRGSLAAASASISEPARPRRDLSRSSSSRPISGDLSTVGERQVVVGQQRGAAGGDEVHRRDVSRGAAAGRRRRSGCRSPSARGSSPRRRRRASAPGSSRRRAECGAAAGGQVDDALGANRREPVPRSSRRCAARAITAGSAPPSRRAACASPRGSGGLRRVDRRPDLDQAGQIARGTRRATAAARRRR